MTPRTARPAWPERDYRRAWVWPVVVAVARRPRLWPAAVAQARRLAAPGWWHRWPPLPLPDPDWLAFRARTAYGDPQHPPEPADVVAWLEWCEDAS